MIRRATAPSTTWSIPLQLTLLIPIVIWLGQQTQIEKRSRRWTAIALAASIAATLLQLLLVTGVLPFAIQVGPVAVCAMLLLCWARGSSAPRDDVIMCFPTQPFALGVQ